MNMIMFGAVFHELQVLVITIALLIILFEIFNKTIFPWIVSIRTKDIEKNPKWIISELQEKYYGFKDMDIIIVNSPLGMIPRFRVDKDDKNRLQMLLPENISLRDIDNIAQIALAGKIKIKYGLWFPDKPANWLAILNYMLDGGNIRM